MFACIDAKKWLAAMSAETAPKADAMTDTAKTQSADSKAAAPASTAASASAKASAADDLRPYDLTDDERDLREVKPPNFLRECLDYLRKASSGVY